MSIGAVAVSARSLAPDLARGAMLLFIALANAHLYLYGYAIGVRAYRVPESILDQTVVLLQMTFVDGRAYPMFTFLFGYGIVQLVRRHTSKGVDEVTVRKLVRRRGSWMIVFGFLHALLLFSGDIIGAYGLLAVLLAGLLIWAGDRKLLIVAGGWAVLIVAFKALLSLSPPEGVESFLPSLFLPSMFATDPLFAAVLRVREWVPLTVITSLFSLIPVLLLGGWAARRRLLDEPERHRPLLIRVAVLGVGLAAYGGGLGDRFGLTATTVLAVVTWALTVLLAEGMSRLGYRGPAEVLLRRLTYGRFPQPCVPGSNLAGAPPLTSINGSCRSEE